MFSKRTGKGRNEEKRNVKKKRRNKKERSWRKKNKKKADERKNEKISREKRGRSKDEGMSEEKEEKKEKEMKVRVVPTALYYNHHTGSLFIADATNKCVWRVAVVAGGQVAVVVAASLNIKPLFLTALRRGRWLVVVVFRWLSG